MAHTIESLIGMIPKTLPGDKAKQVDTVIQLNVTGAQAGQWNVVIKDGNVNVAKGTHAAPELTVTADTDDVLAVANGELDPTSAIMQGKAKVQGDMSEAMELVKVFMST
jgi:putative sterol carrier protein